MASKPDSARTLPRLAWLAIGAGALLLGSRTNRAQSNELNLQFHTFQDTRSVTVLSPTVDLSKDFTGRTTLRLNYGVDAISAASDSCARCHRNGVSSHRQVGGLSITRTFNDWKLTIGGSAGKENFYRSATALTSITRDLARGSTTIAGGYAFSLNQPTLHPTPQIENQYVHDAYGTLTQTLTKTTIAQVGYEVSAMRGYLDNPFLRADVNGLLMLGHVPDQRRRQTFSVRLRQALPAATYLQADYRRYFDDWRLSSNTLSLGVSHDFTPRLLGSFTFRTYGQTGAYFYQPAYTGPAPDFFTADFRLEPFASKLYTGRLVITPTIARFRLPAGASLLLQYRAVPGGQWLQGGDVLHRPAHSLGIPMTRALVVSVLSALAVLSAGLAADPRPARANAPSTLPDVSVADAGGGAVSLSRYKGHVILVDFWASWCLSCKTSFPALDALAREYEPRGVAVLAVNVDERRRDADAFLAEHPHSMTVLFDPKGVAPQAFGVEGMPTSYLIDRTGVVRFTHEGYSARVAGQVPGPSSIDCSRSQDDTHTHDPARAGRRRRADWRPAVRRLRDGTALAARPAGASVDDVRRRPRSSRLHDALAGGAGGFVGRIRRAERGLWL